MRALSRVAAILAYIEVAVLRVKAFSGDFLRYVNDLRSGVLIHHYIIEFLSIFGFFSIELSLCQKNPDFVVVGPNVAISAKTW